MHDVAEFGEAIGDSFLTSHRVSGIRELRSVKCVNADSIDRMYKLEK
jgi:hypothetical protein